MNNRIAAVHRTIVVVDVEGFGDRRRTNQNQLAIREGLYLVMQEAFRDAGISWADQYYEDRGDGMFVLAVPEVPKNVFVELLPYSLLAALRLYNNNHQDVERIRLRMALHAGGVNYDEHGVTSSSINFAFRLIASTLLKEGLAQSSSPLAVITSARFFEEVVRHSAAPAASYRPIRVTVKETEAIGWMYFPAYEDRLINLSQNRSMVRTIPREQSPGERGRAKECREALAYFYKAVLAEPITPAAGMPMGLKVPTLKEGYIDQRIRVAEVTSSTDPGRESWWIGAPVYEEAYRFLTELLSSDTAPKAPIILLGHPGSGKSILTRILVGNLPVNDFLPVRVELRKVPLEGDLQHIIEHAVRDATGESIPWPQLVATTARRVRPVVILDGFDELLQTTGVMHNEFLADVQAFQKREHAVRRPLAVIVTSRIAVTDRTLIPHGATVIKLESFNDDQIEKWLETWARSNQEFFRGDLTPLSAEIAFNYRELAEQPLLLLMLALYDADQNRLQRRSAELGRTELYASLLRDFASREISRQSSRLSPIEFERAVEHELLRLSIAAFSMFNRRSQWVHETDLDADLSVLLNEDAAYSSPRGKSAPLTPAQLTFGRFFFIHEAQAVDDGGGELRTYEFLHSTFGEFLVAHIVVRILSGMAPVNSQPISQTRSVESEEVLRTLLSFSALTARSSIVTFMRDLLHQMIERRRVVATELLLRLHKRALFSSDWRVYGGYEPLALRATERYAAWSVNLVILAVLVGGEITSSQLYPDATDAVNEWRKEVMIWRSQLSGYGWEELHEIIALERVWDDQRREIRLRLNDGTFNAGYPDIFWMYNMSVKSPDRDESFVDRRHNSDIMLRKINFICNMSEDILTHGLEPAISLFPTLANVFVVVDNRTVSAAHAFIAALYAPYGDRTHRDAAFLDLARVAVKLVEVPEMDDDACYLSEALVVLVSAVEKGIADPIVLAPFARIRNSPISPNSRLASLFARLDDLLPSSKLATRASQDDKD